MNDNYSHNVNNVMYVVENIPGPTEHSDEFTELLDKFNSQLAESCECNQSCTHNICNCLRTSGGPNYIKHELKYGLSSKKDFKTQPIVECNSLCPCSNDCGNRLVQKGPIEGLFVKICERKVKGMGLFTKHAIPKGTFICEYAGEVITKSQAFMRHKSNTSQGKMNYIYCLNEHSNGRVTQTFIDPSSFGNIGRYINHSCAPNSHIIPVRIDSPIPKLAIFSCEEILPDTEITFDYGTHNAESTVPASFRSKEMDYVDNRKKCLCNSQRCKGLMPYDVY